MAHLFNLLYLYVAQRNKYEELLKSAIYFKMVILALLVLTYQLFLMNFAYFWAYILLFFGLFVFRKPIS